MKKSILLMLIVLFLSGSVIVRAQSLMEPAFPECPIGYDLIEQFEGVLYSIGTISMTHTFDLECEADLVLRGYAKEGHPEVTECTLSGGPLPICTQHQNFESFQVRVDSDSPFGEYNDNQGLGGVENAWFPAGPWNTTAEAGNHEMIFTHSYPGLVGYESVDYKVTLCARCIEEGNEGCTPGFWKNEGECGSWEETGYSPSDSFADVFGCAITIMAKNGPGRPQENANPTLLEALGANGGGCSALARHGVAGLLNAASSVDYDYSEAEVIAAVCGAIGDAGDADSCDENVKDILNDENEKGCPLSRTQCAVLKNKLLKRK